MNFWFFPFLRIFIAVGVLWSCDPLSLSQYSENESPGYSYSLLYPSPDVRVTYIPSGSLQEVQSTTKRTKCPWNRTSLPIFTEYRTELSIQFTEKKLILQPGDRVEYEFPSMLNHRLQTRASLENLGFTCEGVDLHIKDRSNVISCEGKSRTKLVVENRSNVESRIPPIFLQPLPNEHMELREIELQPHVIFIVIDSLRNDVLGKYSVTPNLDQFEKKSIRFNQYYVNSAWTRPSTAIFLTGKYASEVPINFWDYPVSEAETTAFYNSGIVSLPLLLGTNGYNATMLGNNPFLSSNRSIGADFGFASVQDYSRIEKDTSRITNDAIQYWEKLKVKNRNEYFFLNYNDPHKPYTPPEKFRARVRIPPDEISSIDPRKIDYLGEVVFVDDELGKFFAHLKKISAWDNSLIIITSDHGEVMDPHHAISPFTGTNTLFGHGQSLFKEDIHVPLLIKFPRKSNMYKYHGVKVDKLTQSIDLFPTILSELGIPLPSGIRGISLQDVFEGIVPEDRSYYGETRATQAYQTGDWKLQKKSYRFNRLGFWKGHVGTEKEYLYNLKEDPKERNPILDPANSPDHQSIYRNLKEKLESQVPPQSNYTIRINKPKKDHFKELEIGIYLNAGVVRSIPNQEFFPTVGLRKLGNTSIYKINFKDGIDEELEFQFQVYPDVSYPNFSFKLDGKNLLSSYWGAGSYDINPSNCKLDECLEYYQALSGPPILPKDFRVQVWRTGIEFQKPIERDSLGTEAIDILKKQGYITNED